MIGAFPGVELHSQTKGTWNMIHQEMVNVTKVAFFCVYAAACCRSFIAAESIFSTI